MKISKRVLKMQILTDQSEYNQVLISTKKRNSGCNIHCEDAGGASKEEKEDLYVFS